MLLLGGFFLTGCAAQPSTRNSNVSLEQHVSSIYTPSVASSYDGWGGAALAFDPPVLAGTPRLDLSRDDRQAAAFAGFEDSRTTFYHLHVENKQGDIDRDGYEHKSVSETFGVNYR